MQFFELYAQSIKPLCRLQQSTHSIRAQHGLLALSARRRRVSPDSYETVKTSEIVIQTDTRGGRTPGL
jgi:hypothetical protein